MSFTRRLLDSVCMPSCSVGQEGGGAGDLLKEHWGLLHTSRSLANFNAFGCLWLDINLSAHTS